MTLRHPAPFADAVLDTIADVVNERFEQRGRRPVRLLDPFAGIGRVHELRRMVDPRLVTVGVELEAEWAHAHPATLVGDALDLPAQWGRHFHVVATSPCYGNRMADHHEAKDLCSACDGQGYDITIVYHGVEPRTPCPKCKGSKLSPRHSYRHDLGRMPTEGSAAVMQWGDEYREFHERAWLQVRRVLRPGGLFVLNIKDHVRGDRRQHVSAWHRRTVEALGFRRLETWTVPVLGMRHGANNGARLDSEFVYVFER